MQGVVASSDATRTSAADIEAHLGSLNPSFSGTSPDADADADGVADDVDNCPNVANPDQLDTDGDLRGDVCDTDDDGDGVADGSDAFPLDSSESLDTDSDGVGNNADDDDDGDGVADGSDAYPLISLDGRSDNDGDGLPDECDSACLAIGMSADNDDDGDGISDAYDPEPLLDNSEELGRYELIKLSKTYQSAKNYAVERGAHLATISSDRENAFIYAIVSEAFANNPSEFNTANDGGGAVYIWLGASDIIEEGTWRWDTDETWGEFLNWGKAEPDDYNNQDSLAMGLEGWPKGSGGAYGSASEWNDISAENSLFFVIETEVQ